jgi:hypothetical protein
MTTSSIPGIAYAAVNWQTCSVQVQGRIRVARGEIWPFPQPRQAKRLPLALGGWVADQVEYS